MIPQVDDTIAAPASAAGHGVRGIIRVSGPDTRVCVQRLFEPDDAERWDRATVPFSHRGRLQLTGYRSPVSVRINFWPTPRSYTGQVTAEIHLPGSPPLLESALAELYRFGARPALPGEFTLRAFLAGRLDLVQAEAVLGVIDANEQAGLNRALQQLAGGISTCIAAVHGDLLDLLSDLEAGLDFVEEDIEFISHDEVLSRLDSAGDQIQALQAQAAGRMARAERQRVVIAGLPNAGKSTLFNALVARDAAIVSEVVGTTRDFLSAEVVMGDLSIELVDTAGWEHGSDEISEAAQRLRSDQLDRAALILWCVAADWDDEKLEQDESLFRDLDPGSRPVIRIRTKSDLLPANSNPADGSDLSLCAQSADQIGRLAELIMEQLHDPPGTGEGLIGSTAARCRGSLDAASTAVASASKAARSGVGDDLISAEIREALDHLGAIVGTVYTDDILDRIFSKFCIGK